MTAYERFKEENLNILFVKYIPIVGIYLLYEEDGIEINTMSFVEKIDKEQIEKFHNGGYDKICVYDKECVNWY